MQLSWGLTSGPIKDSPPREVVVLSGMVVVGAGVTEGERIAGSATEQSVLATPKQSRPTTHILVGGGITSNIASRGIMLIAQYQGNVDECEQHKSNVNRKLRDGASCKWGSSR